jgi:hypothetical protein
MYESLAIQFAIAELRMPAKEPGLILTKEGKRSPVLRKNLTTMML